MFRLKRYCCGVLWLALGISPGCALVKYVTPADPKLTYVRGGVTPALGHAPEAGQYALYAQDYPSPTNPADIPPAVLMDPGSILHKGDTYGFERKSDGTVLAVINGQEIAIGAKAADTYFWKLQKLEDSTGR